MTNFTDTDSLIQLNGSDVKEARAKILSEQNGCCAICKKVITDKTGISLDHQHKTKSAPIGKDGAGLIRGVLDRSCNCLEGKIWNNMSRYIQPTCVQDRIDYLRSLISYYEQDTYSLIHPSEKPKEPHVSKRNYNKLKKRYSLELRKKRFPEYPKSSKLTKALSILFNEFDISPYN